MSTLIGPFPTSIVAGTVEDASQIMTMFNWIKNQVNANGCPATSGTSLLKGDGSGGTIAAIANTDYSAPLFQSWHDVTISRALGTTYTNSTGKPIMVSVAMTSTAQALAALTVAGAGVVNGNVSSIGFQLNVTGIVPIGATYSANVNTGTGTLTRWTELS